MVRPGFDSRILISYLILFAPLWGIGHQPLFATLAGPEPLRLLHSRTRIWFWALCSAFFSMTGHVFLVFSCHVGFPNLGSIFMFAFFVLFLLRFNFLSMKFCNYLCNVHLFSIINILQHLHKSVNIQLLPPIYKPISRALYQNTYGYNTRKYRTLNIQYNYQHTLNNYVDWRVVKLFYIS